VLGEHPLARPRAMDVCGMESPAPIETKRLRLREPVKLGHGIGGWRVFWLGGWDKSRVSYVVMVTRTNAETASLVLNREAARNRALPIKPSL
jgi:hypothetical protein